MRAKKYIPWTPEEGFNFSDFPTIKEISMASGVSHHTVRDNITNLLKCLPIEDRIPVLEHMLMARGHRNTTRNPVDALNKNRNKG